MLKALASYFFGGMEDETPEAPVECETREVNDWLVVNLPDHNKDSVNLNDDDEEDDDTYEINDEDIRDELDDDDDEAVEVDVSDINEMDSDEDDILLSLSILMMPPDSEKFSPNLSNDRSISEKRILEMTPSPFLPFNSPFYQPSCMHADHSQVLISSKLIEIMEKSVRYAQTLRRFLPVQPAIKMNDSHREDLLDLIIPGSRHRTKRNDIVSEFERKDKMNLQVLEITPPPMYSKSYVNHRHPEKVLNYDLLQRIQELEPEQQAVQRSVRKNLTRGQLNRQNKNLMYETSSKKNRRSNRQRNHSGANNNRKC